MSEAKHKYRRSSGVLKETRTKNFRISNITIMHKTMWYFGTMHITLRMTIMFSIDGALKKEGGDSRTVTFDGKVEYSYVPNVSIIYACSMHVLCDFAMLL